METRILKSAGPSDESLAEAARILRDGGLVAFPTETVYGLGANALDGRAVEGIFHAKGRPADNPLIVHISDINQVYDLASDITVQAKRVMEAFWPGPLTIVLPRRPGIPDVVTAGLDTVAVRMPDHPAALALIRAAGVPVAAPSANRSGRPSPTTADHVLEDLAGAIDAVLDAGPCRVGLESTVLDLTNEPPVILRPGGVTREELEGVLGHVEATAAHEAEAAPGGSGAPRSPGMKYTHYAPKAPMIVVNVADQAVMQRRIAEKTADYQQEGKKVGILGTDETASHYKADEVISLGSRQDMTTVSHSIYRALRKMDRREVDVIICEGFPAEGLGVAVMNRLIKAAGGNIVTK